MKARISFGALAPAEANELVSKGTVFGAEAVIVSGHGNNPIWGRCA